MIYVAHLDIDIEPLFETRVPKEAKDPKTISLKDFEHVLQSTINLKTLVIAGTTRLAESVLSAEFALHCLPKLEFLSLTASFRSWQDPFHPGHYTLLSYYTELGSFRIHVLRTPSSITHHPKSFEHVSPFYAGLIDVRLTGPLSSSEASVKGLLALFGILFVVHLEDTSYTSRIFSLLNGLIEKPALDDLSLARRLDEGPPPFDLASPEILTQYSSITTLTLSGNCSSTSPSFYSILHNLPKLETLIFGLDAHVSLEHLTTLVSGRTKHKTLETVILDNVDGKVGTKAEETGNPYIDDYGRFRVHRDWEIPKWTESFSRDGFLKFLGLMEDEDIVIEGTALQALDVETEWEGEMDFLMGLEEAYSMPEVDDTI